MVYTSFFDLFELVQKYIHKEESLDLITKAYNWAYELHDGQFRKSGEPYIIHPLNVACILANLHVGPDTICAGLLHDVIEDTNATREELANEFSEDIAEIVDGVTKISNLKFVSLEEKQVENHQKMLLAMGKDIRVIVVKLADRLHNIRTLNFMPEEKRERIARETLEIYAPLAHKLGMFRIKAELEDSSLKYVDREAYIKISSLIKNDTSARISNVDHTIAEIKKILEKENIHDYTIKGRIKNIYSIYKKMVNQNKDFKDIYDILAIRVIVKTISECYQVLGLIHANYSPVPKRFKDYIAVPKPNMYQSLHTTVISADGFTFEVQIRTEEMDQIAELGIAAHWAYKEGIEYNKEKEQFEIAQKLKWYGDLLKFSEEDKNDSAKQYVDAVKEEILTNNVYVYTPTGEVVDLPVGSTPIDFAYKIHTNIGNKTVGAIVNNHIVPLDYELQNGDIISIKTNKNSFGPSEAWLKIAKTSHAKHKIKSFLNKQNRDILLGRGKDLVDEEFKLNKITDYDITDNFVKENFSKNNLLTVDDLFVDCAKGNVSAKTIVSKYTGSMQVNQDQLLNRQIERSQKILSTNSETGVVVEGLKNPLIKIGSCCNPIPGDNIIGYITKGNGIVVHNISCKNCKTFQMERIIPLDWAQDPGRKYPASIKIEATSNINLVVEIMNMVSQCGLSILAINANTHSIETTVKLKVMVKNLTDLKNLIINLQKIRFIYSIERENV